MAWKFDPFIEDIVWQESSETIMEVSFIDFGSIEGDLDIDAGDRTNDISVIDQGIRTEQLE